MAESGSAELFALHVDALYSFDAANRLIGTNEVRPGAGPRVYAGSSGSSRFVRVRQDIPDEVAREWLACGAEELRALVEKRGPILGEHRGPAFVLPPQAAPDDTVTVTSAAQLHPELVARGWLLDETPPYVGAVRDGQVVAVCYSSRLIPQAAAAGVETVEAYRGQGLALDAVRAWAAAVQASGRHAFYSTEWTNEASRRVAAKLGATEIGEDWWLA
jgi:hypothetical protein